VEVKRVRTLDKKYSSSVMKKKKELSCSNPKSESCTTYLPIPLRARNTLRRNRSLYNVPVSL